MKSKTLKLALFAFVLGVLWGAKPAYADPLAVTIGPLTLQVPFQDTHAVSLYDFNAERPLVGAETTIGDIWWFDITAGAVTSLDGHGAPFFGGNFNPSHPFLSKILPENVNLGFFGGYDFNNKVPMYGVKASIGLW